MLLHIAEEDMHRIKELHSELGDIQSVLGIIHNDPSASSSLG